MLSTLIRDTNQIQDVRSLLIEGGRNLLKGWIVYNGNLKDEKFLYQVNWLQRVGNDLGMEITNVKNNDLISTIENGNAVLKGKYANLSPDFVLFWDKDIRLAKHLEKMGCKLFNSAGALEVCDDKSLTYQVLANHGIRMPKTIMAPKVFSFSGVVEFDNYDYIAEEIGFPMVIKEVFGSFGSQVYLIKDKDDMIHKIKELGDTPFIFQEFIASSFGRDIRLNVVGDQVVAAMLRKSESDFRANVTAGGNMFTYTPTEEQIELAVRCSQVVGADFAGVDILFGDDEIPILCEINSNSHFKNIYDCTGVDVALLMMEHIKKNME